MRRKVRGRLAPEILGRLLQRGRELLERRVGPAHRVGQPPHRVHDHQDQPRGGERVAQARHPERAEGAQVADREHHAGDGERHGGDRVEPLPAPHAAAEQEPGDHRAQRHVEQRGEPRVAQRVGDELGRADQDLLVVAEGVDARSRGQAPHLRDRQQQDAHVRQQRGAQQQRDEPPRHQRAARAQHHRRRLAGPAERGELAAGQDRLGEGQRAERQRHQDHADHVAVHVGEADRGHPHVGLRGEQLRVVQHERRAEVVDDADEREQRARRVARQGQRQQHAAEEAQAGAAEVLGRLLERAVEAGQRGRGVEQDERKVVEALHQHHPGEALHERDREARVLAQQQVHRAAPSQDLLEGHRAHEGRDHERQHAQHRDQRPPRKSVAHGEERQRHRDHAADHHREHSRQQRVHERLAEERTRRRTRQRAQRGHACVQDRHRQHLEQRIDDGGGEQDQEGRHQRGLARRAVCHQAAAVGLDSTAGASGAIGCAANVRYSRSSRVCSRRW